MLRKNEYDITCLVGATGSGKTSVAQWLVLYNIKQNKKVFSNVPLTGAYVLDFKDLMKYDFPENSIFIIDEAGVDFNNRDWDKLDKNIIKFFKYHRHFKIDVYIFSQGEDIDITFRRLAHKWYKIKRCFFGFYSRLIPVQTSLSIVNGKWQIVYEAEPSLLGSQYVAIWKTWKYFNSFDKPYNLETKDFKDWGLNMNIIKKKKLKDKIKDSFFLILATFKNLSDKVKQKIKEKE